MGRPLLTHCWRGHAFAGENLLILSKGERRCRECERIRAEKRRARWRECGPPLPKAVVCPSGHRLVGENLRVTPCQVLCRECERARQRRYWERRKERGIPKRAKGASSREAGRRRKMRAEIAALIERYEGDGDISLVLPALAERLRLSLSTVEFELGWQMGLYDLPADEQ